MYRLIFLLLFFFPALASAACSVGDKACGDWDCSSAMASCNSSQASYPYCKTGCFDLYQARNGYDMGACGYFPVSSAGGLQGLAEGSTVGYLAQAYGNYSVGGFFNCVWVEGQCSSAVSGSNASPDLESTYPQCKCQVGATKYKAFPDNPIDGRYACCKNDFFWDAPHQQCACPVGSIETPILDAQNNPTGKTACISEKCQENEVVSGCLCNGEYAPIPDANGTNICVPKCSFGKDSTGKCLCPPWFSTGEPNSICSQPSPDQCFSNSMNSYITGPRHTDSLYCKEECPDGQGTDGITNKCFVCDGEVINNVCSKVPVKCDSNQIRVDANTCKGCAIPDGSVSTATVENNICVYHVGVPDGCLIDNGSLKCIPDIPKGCLLANGTPCPEQASIPEGCISFNDGTGSVLRCSSPIDNQNACLTTSGGSTFCMSNSGNVHGEICTAYEKPTADGKCVCQATFCGSATCVKILSVPILDSDGKPTGKNECVLDKDGDGKPDGKVADKTPSGDTCTAPYILNPVDKHCYLDANGDGKIDGLPEDNGNSIEKEQLSTLDNILDTIKEFSIVGLIKGLTEFVSDIVKSFGDWLSNTFGFSPPPDGEFNIWEKIQSVLPEIPFSGACTIQDAPISFSLSGVNSTATFKFSMLCPLAYVVKFMLFLTVVINGFNGIVRSVYNALDMGG